MKRLLLITCFVFTLLTSTVLISSAFSAGDPECLGPSYFHAWATWQPQCYCFGTDTWVQPQRCEPNPSAPGCTVIDCSF